jgi:hypothetical protein
MAWKTLQQDRFNLTKGAAWHQVNNLNGVHAQLTQDSSIHCCTDFAREVWVEPTQDNTKENQASPSLYVFTTQKNRCYKSGDDNEPRKKLHRLWKVVYKETKMIVFFILTLITRLLFVWPTNQRYPNPEDGLFFFILTLITRLLFVWPTNQRYPNPEDGRFIFASDKVFSLLSEKRGGNRRAGVVNRSFICSKWNLQTQAHHEGWMVCGHETLFHWVPVPLLTMVVSSAQLRFWINYLPTTNNPLALHLSINNLHALVSPIVLPIYPERSSLVKGWVTKVEANVNLIWVHPQLSHNRGFQWIDWCG